MQVEDYGLMIVFTDGKVYPLDDDHLNFAFKENAFFITSKGKKIIKIKFFSNDLFYLYKPYNSNNFRILYTKDLNVDFLFKIAKL